MVNLTQKERTLLEDQKHHEELCIKKYGNYAEQAQDSQLKEMFTKFQQKEQQHYNTINQILNGQMPQMQNQGQSQQQQQGMGMQQNQQMQGQQMTSGKTGLINQSDIDLCNDMLATEKYISHTYDTAIFEFRDKNIRNILNHIQKEEQEHGEELFKYMQSKGGYNIQGASS